MRRLLPLLLLLACTEYELGTGKKQPKDSNPPVSGDDDDDDAVDDIPGTPAIRADPDNVAFGQLGVGCTDVRIVALHNDGDGTLHINELVILGDAAGDFVADDLAGVRIAPGAKKMFNLFFDPQVAGTRATEVLIRSDAPDLAITTAGKAVSEEEVIDTFTQNSAGSGTVFTLTDTPIDPGAIRVDVGGVTVPSSLWSFNAFDNTIEFDSATVPPASSSIEVSYLVRASC